MIAEARKRSGISGALRIAPVIIRHAIKNPPRIGKERKRDG
jgi:hypothetical protein